jgi:hypothetical protein
MRSNDPTTSGGLGCVFDHTIASNTSEGDDDSGGLGRTHGRVFASGSRASDGVRSGGADPSDLPSS